MPGARLLLHADAGVASSRPDDFVTAVVLLTIVAATLALVARVFVQFGSAYPCSSLCGLASGRGQATRGWQSWELKCRSSSVKNDDVRLELEGDAKSMLPASLQALGDEASGKGDQPLSGWIRSMRPPQGYALVQGAAPCSPLRIDVHLLDDVTLAPCGDEQCVTPNKLSPHPELPRIRVTVPSPTLRQKHAALS